MSHFKSTGTRKGNYCVQLKNDFAFLVLQIVNTQGSRVFKAVCPAGKQVLGCHIDPRNSQTENWRYWYPATDGSSCTCYDYYGAKCVATCASNINNYEVVSVSGSGLNLFLYSEPS
jgi:hypothetical protein